MEAYLSRFLAAPQTILEASLDLQLAIVSYIDTPQRLLEILVTSPDLDVASAARLHVTWAGEIEGDAERTIDDLLKTQQLGQNDRLAVELLKLGTVPPCFVSQWVPPNKIVERLDNPHMPLEYKIQLLQRLATEDRLDIVVPVAGSLDTPPPLLAQLIGSVHLAIRDTARNNPSSLPETIASIDREYEIAANWDTQPAQLAISATSRWEWIRLTVAQNPFTSAETLLVLAQAEVARIRLAVAHNPHTPAAVLQVLAENNEGEVRSLVAKHPHVSEETLHYLFTDCQNVLRGRTDLPLSILERFFDDRNRSVPIWKDSGTRNYLLRAVNTSPELLEQLAADCHQEIRVYYEGIKQEYHSREVVEGWIVDATDYLKSIIEHPNIGVGTLDRLSKHPNPQVRLAVCLNIKTPPELKEALLIELGCQPIKLRLLESKSVINDMNIKSAIARDINTPIDILVRMGSQEFLENKILAGIRRTLNSEYSVNCNEFLDHIDRSIHRLKHQILRPAGIEIDVDRWMDLLQQKNVDFDTVLKPRWQELLSALPQHSFQEALDIVYSAVREISREIQRNDYWKQIVAALLENPRTPENLREQLLEQEQQKSDRDRSYYGDASLRLALSLNPTVDEDRRIEDAWGLRLYHNSSYGNCIARHPQTSPKMFRKLMEDGSRFCYAIVENQNAPHDILLELSISSDSGIRGKIARNLNTPIDILLTLTNDGALENPNFPPLERYRVNLENALVTERQATSELIASLPLNTKLSLTQVVEGNELPAKLSIARDLQTPIDILERLAQDPNEDVRCTVANNRNLPLKTLLKLADDSSKKVRAQLVSQQSNRSTPVEILIKLSDDPDTDIRMYIARNSNTPTEVLAKLALRKDPYEYGWVTSALVNNPNTSVETLEYLGVERFVVNAYNKKTPPNALAAQVDYALTMHTAEKERIFEFLLRDLEGSQMPASSLVKLATNSESWIRSRVASHRNTPAATLEQLSNDKSYEPILWGIARNPNSPPALLEKLLREDYQTVANYMVERAIIPPNIMGRLLESESEHLRSRIVSRNNLPLELADRVINTETHDSVLISLARNPILTSELISTFIQRHALKPDICIALLVHPNLTLEHWQQLANSQFEPVRLAIASRQNTPSDILAILADDRELQIRMAIASNIQTPSDILIKLATDPEVEVRTKIAANPQTPIPILETLAADTSVEVCRSVLNNPQTPVSTRQDLEDIFGRKPIATTIDTLRDLPRIYDLANDDLTTILTEYAGSSNNFVRLVSLLHPLMPVEVIERAARSPYWSDRYAVAKNPTTPARLRQNLVRDSNRIVRAIASMMTS